MSELTEQQLDDRRTSSPVQIVAIMGLLVTLATLLFSVGYNWRGLSEAGDNQEKFQTVVERDYVRKDVNEQQMQRLENKLSEISFRLAELQSRSGSAK